VNLPFENCPVTHPRIDGGAPCIYRAGHAAVGLPHVTANGLYWYEDGEDVQAQG